jgi:UDP-glucuronate decarboxylase
MNSTDEFTGPVNLGNPTEVSILALAEKIIELIGSDSKIVFKPLPQDDPLKRRPDISLAREVLHWEPKTSLSEGLQKTIDHFKEVMGNSETMPL